jgi:hypothetical protein
MIFFLLVMVILVFVVMWNFDLHKILFAKYVTQNAGDSAALMAARWQAVSLNLVGDLNLMHAVALSNDDLDTASSITQIQARICFTGPMIAFMASQQAAKNNGVYRNDDFDTLCREHAAAVRTDYPSRAAADGSMLFPEPYPGCWEEYANMLELIASEGIAAGPDNAKLYGDSAGGHPLLEYGFYEAIAGQNWCWFFNNEPDLLEDYQEFFPCWWPAIPEPPNMQFINSEIYGLGLRRVVTGLDNILTVSEANTGVSERGLIGSVSSNAMDVDAVWYCYNASWTAWDAIKPYGSADAFPVTGTLKQQFDYAGSDAAVRIEERVDRFTPGAGGAQASDYITWTAAAKPFGYLNETDTPNSCDLVLPAYRDVRLIPLDASSAPEGGGYDLEWREHIEVHLDKYLAGGTGAIQGDPDMRNCWYCEQLVTWESAAFRQSGVDWLSVNSYMCTVTGGSGGSRGGGTRRGH